MKSRVFLFVVKEKKAGNEGKSSGKDLHNQ